MNKYQLIGIALIGVVTIYIYTETFELIDPRQYHIEFGSYPTTPLFPMTTVSGTASTYSGTVNFTKVL